MRLTTVLSVIALPLTAFAAKSKDAGATFAKYHAKSLSSTPVKLDDASFKELTTAPRDYGAVLCLTAMGPQFGCKICQEWDPEWQLLAKSWTKGDKQGEGRIVFGTLDFLDGRSSFQSLHLDTAPVVLYFPPTSGPNAAASPDPLKYEFMNGGLKAEAVHSWLGRNVPASAPKPPLHRPFNYFRILILITVLLGAITAVVAAWPYLLPMVQSRNVWASGCIVAILLFTSGHMYNHIRGTPYVASNGKGGVQYFAPGFQNQFGMESQLVAVMYAVLAFSTIYLTLRAPRIQDPKAQQAAVFLWGAVMYGMYSFLLSVFRLKNAGYPYGLPPF